MNFFVSLRTGIPVFSYVLESGRTHVSNQYIYPIDIDDELDRGRGYLSNCAPDEPDDTFQTLLEMRQIPVPLSPSQLRELSDVTETGLPETDIYLPFPFDPLGNTNLMVGDKVRTRFGTEGRVRRFDLLESGRTQVEIDSDSMHENTETINTDELDVGFRLEERPVVDWETYITYMIWESKRENMAIVKGGGMPAPHEVREWTDEVAVVHPYESKYSVMPDAIIEAHLRGFPANDDSAGGEFSGCYLNRHVERTLKEMGLGGFTEDQLMDEVGADIWGHYAKADSAKAAPTGSVLHDLLKSKYSSAPPGRKKYRFSFRRVEDIRSAISDGESPAPRKKENAYGLDETKGEEEMLEDFLSEGL